MQNEIQTLQKLFPRASGQQNSAVTGVIPIELFDSMEDSLRPLMRKAGLRAMYRGPRRSNDCFGVPSMTVRKDATGVLLYSK